MQRGNAYCQRGPTHDGKQIIMICLNPECEARRTCCLTCIDELHRKHELISLERLEAMMQVLNTRADPEVKLAVTS
jgi:phosphopantothenate synthetase